MAHRWACCFLLWLRFRLGVASEQFSKAGDAPLQISDLLQDAPHSPALTAAPAEVVRLKYGLSGL